MEPHFNARVPQHSHEPQRDWAPPNHHSAPYPHTQPYISHSTPPNLGNKPQSPVDFPHNSRSRLTSAELLANSPPAVVVPNEELLPRNLHQQTPMDADSPDQQPTHQAFEPGEFLHHTAPSPQQKSGALDTPLEVRASQPHKGAGKTPDSARPPDISPQPLPAKQSWQGRALRSSSLPTYPEAHPSYHQMLNHPQSPRARQGHVPQAWHPDAHDIQDDHPHRAVAVRRPAPTARDSSLERHPHERALPARDRRQQSMQGSHFRTRSASMQDLQHFDDQPEPLSGYRYTRGQSAYHSQFPSYANSHPARLLAPALRTSSLPVAPDVHGFIHGVREAGQPGSAHAQYKHVSGYGLHRSPTVWYERQPGHRYVTSYTQPADDYYKEVMPWQPQLQSRWEPLPWPEYLAPLSHPFAYAERMHEHEQDRRFRRHHQLSQYSHMEPMYPYAEDMHSHSPTANQRSNNWAASHPNKSQRHYARDDRDIAPVYHRRCVDDGADEWPHAPEPAARDGRPGSQGWHDSRPKRDRRSSVMFQDDDEFQYASQEPAAKYTAPATAAHKLSTALPQPPRLAAIKTRPSAQNQLNTAHTEAVATFASQAPGPSNPVSTYGGLASKPADKVTSFMELLTSPLSDTAVAEPLQPAALNSGGGPAPWTTSYESIKDYLSQLERLGTAETSARKSAAAVQVLQQVTQANFAQLKRVLLQHYTRLQGKAEKLAVLQLMVKSEALYTRHAQPAGQRHGMGTANQQGATQHEGAATAVDGRKTRKRGARSGSNTPGEVAPTLNAPKRPRRGQATSVTPQPKNAAKFSQAVHKVLAEAPHPSLAPNGYAVPITMTQSPGGMTHCPPVPPGSMAQPPQFQAATTGMNYSPSQQPFPDTSHYPQHHNHNPPVNSSHAAMPASQANGHWDPVTAQPNGPASHYPHQYNPTHQALGGSQGPVSNQYHATTHAANAPFGQQQHVLSAHPHEATDQTPPPHPGPAHNLTNPYLLGPNDAAPNAHAGGSMQPASHDYLLGAAGSNQIRSCENSPGSSHTAPVRHSAAMNQAYTHANAGTNPSTPAVEFGSLGAALPSAQGVTQLDGLWEQINAMPMANADGPGAFAGEAGTWPSHVDDVTDDFLTQLIESM